MQATFWMPEDGPSAHAIWYRPFLLLALVFPGLRPWFAALSRPERPPRPAPARWQPARKEWSARLHVGGWLILENDRSNYCIREGRTDCRKCDAQVWDGSCHAQMDLSMNVHLLFRQRVELLQLFVWAGARTVTFHR